MNKKKALGRALSYIGRYKLLMLLSLIFATGTVVMTLFVPRLIGDAIDLIVGKGAVVMDRVITILFTAMILVVATALLQWIMSVINNRITYSVTKDMRNDGFKKIQRLPLSYLDNHPLGDTLSRMISDIDQFADGLLLGFTQLFTGVLTIILTLIFMLSINWIVALVVVILTPLSLFIARFIGTRTHSMFLLRSKQNGECTAFIDENIGNGKLLIAFGKEAAAAARFGEINERLEKSTRRAIFFSSLVNPTTRFVNNIVYAAVALVGAFSVIGLIPAEAGFGVGMLTCLLSYTNQYTKPFNEISGVIAEFQSALASAGRFFELIESEEEVSDADGGELSCVEGNIDFRCVSFSYTEQKSLIENLNLSVLGGKRVAIVGPTGSGKTTLINLLMRFYDTTGGSITVDGADIKTLKRRSLRENYGMVLQESWLFSGSIRDNIKIGRPDATDEEIIAAARASHAHGFIKRLENGYDTLISENDGTLSEGQKQLIAVTRIMLSLPPMLILDEATSSIDTRTEMKIQDAFSELMVGRTSFIVAHRLSTVMNADIILVMKNGSIIEQGSHNELLEKGGFYKTLYDSQFAH